MIRIGDYLRPETIIELETVKHDEIIDRLITLCLGPAAPGKGRDGGRRRMARVLAMNDQALEGGFAMTHARVDGPGEIRVAAGLLPRPARFAGCPDVHTVICAIIPADKSAAYLGFMARLSRMLLRAGPREAFAARDRESILRRIESFDA